MLRRRRVCISVGCNHKFSTIEALVDSGVRHNDAVVIVLPKNIARELRAAFSVVGKHLDLDEKPSSEKPND